jgi:hypothetical protein
MPQPKDGGPRKWYPKFLVCKWCREHDHKRCPGCDCSQVKHQIELVLEEAA